VVTVLPESHQALLYDKTRGTHVLAEVGATVGEYKVEEITAQDITLSTHGRDLVLTAPGSTPPPPAARSAPPAATAGDDPLDPYVATTGTDAAPIDPYEEPEPEVRTAIAPKPILAGEGGVRVSSAANPAAISPAVPSAAPAAPAPESAMPGPTASTKPIEHTVLLDATSDPAVVIPRADLDRALADFGALAASVRGTFGTTGVRLDMVAGGSLFAQAGLRTGDVITAVNGKPLRVLDDAAELYAQAASARAVTLQVVRGSKPLTLRVSFR
jgi:membrane-associated protease RseP (regulator of RpoE activity)